MLAAIAELAGAVPATLQPAAAIEPKPHDAAERRQLTVMFCDLVGSTALSARLDPEDLREIINAYHRRCAEVIVKHGGFVAGYLGDGILAYFGYPHAHEHNAERAARAGLALVGAGTKLGGTPLRMRVGIATGLVVVGDLFADDPTHECEVVGETPDLASRLQTLAEPNTVVIDFNTRRLLGELFEYCPLGTLSLKSPLGTGRDGRRTGGPDLGRVRDRQVAHRSECGGAAKRRTTYPTTVLLLAPPPGHRSISEHCSA
jgi:class 3 adenylate cyclase